MKILYALILSSKQYQKLRYLHKKKINYAEIVVCICLGRSRFEKRHFSLKITYYIFSEAHLDLMPQNEHFQND